LVSPDLPPAMSMIFFIARLRRWHWRA